jgi:hypothetical protein
MRSKAFMKIKMMKNPEYMKIQGLMKLDYQNKKESERLKVLN